MLLNLGQMFDRCLLLLLYTQIDSNLIREASHIDFVHEKRHIFWKAPHPPPLRNVMQALRLSVVYKRIKVHLGQGQDLIVSIKIYLKYKYTNENAGFCVF